MLGTAYWKMEVKIQMLQLHDLVALPESRDPSQDPLDRKVGEPQNATNPVANVSPPTAGIETRFAGNPTGGKLV